jgi:hypothetical protein
MTTKEGLEEAARMLCAPASCLGHPWLVELMQDVITHKNNEEDLFIDSSVHFFIESMKK